MSVDIFGLLEPVIEMSGFDFVIWSKKSQKLAEHNYSSILNEWMKMKFGFHHKQIIKIHKYSYKVIFIMQVQNTRLTTQTNIAFPAHSSKKQNLFTKVAFIDPSKREKIRFRRSQPVTI